MKLERLTYKSEFAFIETEPLKYAPKKPIVTANGDDESLFNLVDVLNKLGKLEDIEEKLGIDADTIFKVLEIIKDMRGYKDNEAIANLITIVEESQDFEKFSARCRSFTKEEYDVLKEVFK